MTRANTPASRRSGVCSRLEPGRAPVPGGARAKTAAVVVLALLTSMLSPVAGLFLGVAAAALVVCGHRWQGRSMGLPPRSR